MPSSASSVEAGWASFTIARDVRLDRPVALKVLPTLVAREADTRERFLREARTAAQLSHPNIAPIYRADEINGLAFFAMGFVDGETVADRIRDRGPLGPAEVVRILREVAWARAYAHARGIVHRDMKPENILLDRTPGRAVVTDFGIARTTFDPSITQAGHVLGSVHYMSPEQCAGDALDGRSDLYALGVTGFFALSGRLPFDGDAPEAIIVAHATRNPPPLRSYAPDVPASLAAVIDGCLQKNPDDRFPTGETLAEALTKALEDAPSTAGPSGRVVLSSEQAAAVWRRAAQFQAEAAARLELRVRDTGIGAETRAMLAHDPASESAAAPDSAPTDGYRAHDVEAAAVEAGISQRYVALAMAELGSSPTGGLASPTPTSPRKEALAARLLGTTQRSLSVSRTFRFAPRIVLTALGRSLQSPPYSLELRDTVGGRPLDGGVLVFGIPDMATSDYRWTWMRYGVYVPELRLTLAPLRGDPKSCEVTVYVDLHRGLTANIVGMGSAIGGSGAVTGGITAAICAKTLALTGLAVAAPAVGVAALAAGAVYAASGSLYRWSMRKAAAEIERALAAVDASIRAYDIFGEAPRTPARRPSSSDELLPR